MPVQYIYYRDIQRDEKLFLKVYDLSNFKHTGLNMPTVSKQKDIKTKSKLKILKAKKPIIQARNKETR